MQTKLLSRLGTGLLLTAVFGWSLAAPDPSYAQKKLTIKLAHVFSVDSLEDKTHKVFKDIVDKESNKMVEIQIFPAGQIGNMRDMLDGFKSNMSNGTFLSASALGFYSAMAAVDVWPYLFNDYREFEKAYAAAGGKEFIAEIERTTGFKVLAPTYKGGRHVYSRKPVYKVEDLRGLKIRAPGIEVYMKTWNLLGANPIPMDLTEVFVAIQQGVIDAAENELQAAYTYGWQESAKYLIMTRHAMSNYSWIFWDKWFSGLPIETQRVLEKASYGSAKWFTEQTLKVEEDIIPRFKQAGVTVIQPDLKPFKDKIEIPMKKALPELAKWADKLQEKAKSK